MGCGGYFSAVFAGLTSILAKCGIKKTDSDLATSLRTVVVFCFQGKAVKKGAYRTYSDGDRNVDHGDTLSEYGSTKMHFYQADKSAFCIFRYSGRSYSILLDFSCYILYNNYI